MADDRRQPYQSASPGGGSEGRQSGYVQDKRGLNTKIHLAVDAHGMPALRDAQGIIVGKAGLAFRNLPELAVEALNHIRRVYGFTNLGRIFIEGAQDFPIFLPAFHAGGVLFSPFLREPKQVFFRLIQRDGGIDFLQVSLHLLDVLPTTKRVEERI